MLGLLLCSLLFLTSLSSLSVAAESEGTPLQVAYSRGSYTGAAGLLENDVFFLEQLWAAWEELYQQPVNIHTYSQVDHAQKAVAAGDLDVLLTFHDKGMSGDAIHLVSDNVLLYKSKNVVANEPGPDDEILVWKGGFTYHWLKKYRPEWNIRSFNNMTDVQKIAKSGNAHWAAGVESYFDFFLGGVGASREFTKVALKGSELHLVAEVQQRDHDLIEKLDHFSDVIRGNGVRSFTQALPNQNGSLFIRSALSVALDKGMYPLSFSGAFGNPGGLFVDIWRKWSEKTGIPVEFHLGTPEENLAALHSGGVDIYGAVSKSASRERWMSFLHPVYMLASTFFFRTDIGPVSSYDALLGQRVGVLEGSTQAEFVEKWIPSAVVVPFLFPMKQWSAVSKMGLSEPLWQKKFRFRHFWMNPLWLP